MNNMGEMIWIITKIFRYSLVQNHIVTMNIKFNF